MILNMNQLRAFYTAAKLQSITKAAHELMVTPPAITMQVKQLEETVGIRLLVRDGNSIQLTHAGESVFKRAGKIFQEIHDMEGFFEDLSTGKSGELRIGCPETPLKRLMPLIAAFKTTYPGIRIVIDQASNAEMVKSIEDHRNELAVIRYKPNNSRLKVKIIWKYEVILVASPNSVHLPGSEISVMQLSGIPLIMRREGSAVREVVLEYLRKFKVNPLIAMESASLVLLKEFVQQDNGVSFFERDAIEEELSNGTLKPIHILEGSPTLGFGIGYRNRKDLSPPAWAFLRLFDKPEVLSMFFK
ncbi:MAG: LysR family transcriptional regulator [Proteobacteria bacterium]|nr:LysR family transcriptional regulator [Pseudomonadota bacterium]